MTAENLSVTTFEHGSDSGDQELLSQHPTVVPSPRVSAPTVITESLQLGPTRSHGRYATVLRFGIRPYLLAFDALAVALAGIANGWENGQLWIIPIVITLFAFADLYRPRLTLSVLSDTPRILGRAVLATTLVQVGNAVVTDDHKLSFGLLGAGVLASLFLLVGRALAYQIARSARSRAYVAHPTLILGAGKVGVQIAGLLLDHPEFGLRPVGFLDGDPLTPEDSRPLPLLGDDAGLAQTIVEFGVRDVVIAFGSMRESSLVEVIRTCDRLDADIFFVPRLFELHEAGRDVDLVWGMPLVRLRRPAFRSPSWRLKRVIDAIVAAIALVITSPILAAVAIAVRIDGGPGILFRQERVGLDGRPFKVLKFRSLKPANESEAQVTWNIKHDARLSSVGRFLRQTSLDELPQLWNILRGDMSLVGPRPERPYFVQTFSDLYPRYTARHRVPAGITGWAQVHGLRGDTSIEERARFDNFYIENWSLWLDIKIILMTVPAVLRRRGAG